MKRILNIFFHNIRELKRNKKFCYKVRFSLFSFFVLGILVIGFYSLVRSFAIYESNANLSLDIQTAMYVLDEGEMSFNIDLNQIVPSDDSYIYTFSISNFNEERRTDVDLEYGLQIQSTTNLPLSYRLYYDNYGTDGEDIISLRELKQDEDSSWYNLLQIDNKYEFSHTENKTNIYYLVIDFPSSYKENIKYSDAVENIKVMVDSKQII